MRMGQSRLDDAGQRRLDADRLGFLTLVRHLENSTQHHSRIKLARPDSFRNLRNLVASARLRP